MVAEGLDDMPQQVVPAVSALDLDVDFPIACPRWRALGRGTFAFHISFLRASWITDTSTSTTP